MARMAHPEDNGALGQYVFPGKGPRSMIIVGEWRVCDDGVNRPALRGKVQAHDGAYQVDAFLVDSCVDRTVW